MRHLVTAALFAILFFQGCSKKDRSNETNTTQSIDPAQQTLTLSIGNNELPENNETTVTVTAADGKDITTAGGIVWHMSDTNATEINGTKLIAKQEGTTTIQAEFNGKYSQEQNVTVYKLIHGHRLPPEPDPKLNNSTLLGIDSNHNGVRDDVERWIYLTNAHPIERGLFMQSARAYQKVIVDPSKAHETTKYLDDVVSCELYLKYIEKDQPISRYRDIEEEISQIQFNTLVRHMAYERYNAEFNGEVFSAPKASKGKCFFDKNGNLAPQP